MLLSRKILLLSRKFFRCSRLNDSRLDLLARPPSGGASRLEIWGQKIEFEIEWIRELVHVSPGLRLDGTAGDEESWIESGLTLVPDLDCRSDLGSGFVSDSDD